ncbi:MAG: hypothetical protein JW818_14660 [Pirellulales bacterium]|nr:hypothetical protein [Pirellulales bacterium]
MATTEEIQKIICQQCYALLDASDQFCRHCGAPTSATDGYNPYCPPGGTPPVQTGWADHPAFVLAMLFFVLGPLGLPMLWRCRRIAPHWRVLLSVLMLGAVVFVLAGVWHVFHQALAPLQQLQKFGAH